MAYHNQDVFSNASDSLSPLLEEPLATGYLHTQFWDASTRFVGMCLTDM